MVFEVSAPGMGSRDGFNRRPTFETKDFLFVLEHAEEFSILRSRAWSASSRRGSYYS